MDKWKPSQSDIDWTKNHIKQITENGIWVVPHGNNSEFRFSHENKTYDAVIHAATPSEQQTVIRIMDVLKRLDYLASSILWDAENRLGKNKLKKFQDENA